MIGVMRIDAAASEQTVRIVGEVRDRFRIEAIERTRLGGRNQWLEPGQRAFVPRRTVRLVNDVADPRD